MYISQLCIDAKHEYVLYRQVEKLLKQTKTTGGNKFIGLDLNHMYNADFSKVKLVTGAIVSGMI